jgi:hypothetical protein
MVRELSGLLGRGGTVAAPVVIVSAGEPLAAEDLQKFYVAGTV